MGNILISISIYILIDDQMEICWNIFISTLATDEPSKSFLQKKIALIMIIIFLHSGAVLVGILMALK